jgi:hypothetical protein
VTSWRKLSVHPVGSLPSFNVLPLIEKLNLLAMELFYQKRSSELAGDNIHQQFCS